MKKHFKFTTILLALCMLCASSASAAEVQRLAFGTASIGGNYYVIGSAMATMWNQELKDSYEITAEVTNGAGANIGLVENGDLQIALTSAPTAYNGYIGEGWAQGTKYSNIRAMAGLMPSGLEIFAPKGSGIASIQDFNGKTMTTGPTSGSGSIMALDLFQTLNIKPGKKQDLAWGDAVGNIVDGLIDCGLDFASFPHAARAELVANMEVDWIELTPEERKLMCETYPYYYEDVMPADTYKFLPAEGYDTIMSTNILFCHKDVDEETVYQLTKAMYANLDDLILASDSCKSIKEENVIMAAIPLHPGAIRYYEEKGIKLPESAYPPEYVKK